MFEVSKVHLTYSKANWAEVEHYKDKLAIYAIFHHLTPLEANSTGSG